MLIRLKIKINKTKSDSMNANLSSENGAGELSLFHDQGWYQKYSDRRGVTRLKCNFHASFCQIYSQKNLKFPPMGARCFRWGGYSPLLAQPLSLFTLQSTQYSAGCRKQLCSVCMAAVEEQQLPLFSILYSCIG